jgi:hypothetical protein
MADDHEPATAFDPKRRLCPDGSCVGIIGSDGRCSVCGSSARGHPSPDAEATEPRPSDAPGPDAELGIDADQRDEKPGPAFNPHRRLCSDGTCIGVIGKDNRCQVCGKPA